MSAEGLDVEVLKRSSLRLGNVLTKRQSEVLYAAISMCYFSNTRKIVDKIFSVIFLPIAEIFPVIKHKLKCHFPYVLKDRFGFWIIGYSLFK
jgi:hypothetical protein